jgi:hypothetical protein
MTAIDRNRSGYGTVRRTRLAKYQGAYGRFVQWKPPFPHRSKPLGHPGCWRSGGQCPGRSGYPARPSPSGRWPALTISGVTFTVAICVAPACWLCGQKSAGRMAGLRRVFGIGAVPLIGRDRVARLARSGVSFSCVPVRQGCSSHQTALDRAVRTPFAGLPAVRRSTCPRSTT